MLETIVIAAFLTGIGGGVHCAAMCGPLTAAVFAARGGRRSGWLGRALAYNAGRIASYVAAGATTGALGAGGLALRATPLTQQALLAAMSLALMLMAAHLAGVPVLSRAIEAGGSALWRRVEPWSRRFLPADTAGRAFGLGLIWGWLPCGMVYVALIAALTTADPVHGALVMAAFGLGTLPNLLALSAWFSHVARRAQGRLARTLVAAVLALAGMAGIAAAAHPAAVSAAGSWCMQVPGIGALFGAGG